MRSTQPGTWRTLTYGPGTRYPVTRIEGIDDLPDVRTADVARPQRDGSWSGPDYLEPRVIDLGLGIQADDGVDLEARRQTIKASLGPSRTPETLVLTDGRVVYAKLRKSAILSDMSYDWRLGDVVLQFYCADPRVYGSDYQLVNLIAGTPRVDGRTYIRAYTLANAPPNLAPPSGPGWSFPQTTQTVASGTVINNGNVDAPVDVTITGTLQTPIIEVVGVSTTQLNITLASGDVLKLTRDWQILLNDIPRRDLLAIGSNFPMIPPGTWTVRLSSRGGTGSATVEIRSASL